MFNHITTFELNVANEGIDTCKIEFRAETYMEPQSKYAIFVRNSEDEVECKVEGLSLPMQIVKDAQSGMYHWFGIYR